ncbi:MAG: hypothetical protein ABMA64_02035, partial [Myxococcota bacterium]
GEVAGRVAASNVHEESWVGAWTGADSGPDGPSDEEGGDDSAPEGDGPPPSEDVPVDPPAGDDDPSGGTSGPTGGEGGGPTAVPGCTGPQGGTYDDLLGDWSPYGDDRTVDDPFDDDQGYLGGEEEGETPDPSDILPDGEVQLPPEEEPPPGPTEAMVQIGGVLIVLEIEAGLVMVIGVSIGFLAGLWMSESKGCIVTCYPMPEPGCEGPFVGFGVGASHYETCRDARKMAVLNLEQQGCALDYCDEVLL